MGSLCCQDVLATEHYDSEDLRGGASVSHVLEEWLWLQGLAAGLGALSSVPVSKHRHCCPTCCACQPRFGAFLQFFVTEGKEASSTGVAKPVP